MATRKSLLYIHDSHYNSTHSSVTMTYPFLSNLPEYYKIDFYIIIKGCLHPEGGPNPQRKLREGQVLPEVQGHFFRCFTRKLPRNSPAHMHQRFTPKSPGKWSWIPRFTGVLQTPLKSRELSSMAFIRRKILALLHFESAGGSWLSQQSFILPAPSSWTQKKDL